jgi:hypothetical protein
MRRSGFVPLLGLLLALPFAVATARGADGTPASTTPDAKSPASALAATSAPKVASEGALARWFEINQAVIGVRHRFTEDTIAPRNGVDATPDFSGMQHRALFKGTLKFDPKGNYSVTGLVGTGSNFSGSWNTTGPGSGELLSNLYLKQLYFTARPIAGVEVAVGGLGIVRGESTELTSYDDDGYLVGERVSLRRPKELFFDEVTVTNAYLGDFTKPGVNKRFNRMDDANYQQVLLVKKLGGRATISGEFTTAARNETLRQAISIGTKESKILDKIRLELYERYDPFPAAGFAITGEKTLFERLTLVGGYASVDAKADFINGDRYGKGKRLHLAGTIALTPELSVQGFVTRAVGNDDALVLPVKTRTDVIVLFNVLKALQRTSLF